MKQSAGILVYRLRTAGPEVLLVHPGGPFWAKKDLGAWSIPKGEFEAGEEPLAAARREFKEEVGQTVPSGELIELGEAKQAGGKVVLVWAVQGDLDVRHIKSSTFQMEWPPKSGRQQEFPECDRAGWFSLTSAQTKLVKGQVVFIERLAEKLGASLGPPPEQAALF